MRGRGLRRALVALAPLPAVLAAAFFLWPAPPLPEPRLDARAIAADPAGYLERQEGEVPGLRPGARKRVVWAGAPDARTRLSVVYIHGFSASAMEISPVPERVAAALDANLVLTRLTGHGRDGAAMGEATVGAWMTDLAEALAVARAVGERVVVIGTSTGGTLATLAAADPDLARDMAGVALLSPNYGLRLPGEHLPILPGFTRWGPFIVGSEWEFEPLSEAHAAHWTTSYPLRALRPMAQVVDHARRLDPSRITVPALVLYSEADRVVDPAETRAMAAAWGGKVAMTPLTPGPGDDPMGHVLAGDILSPGLTDTVVEAIVAWARTL